MSTVVEERLKLASIESLCIKGAIGKFGRCMQLEEDKNLFFKSTTADMLKAEVQRIKNDGQTLKFPIAICEVQTLRRNTERSPNRTLFRHGIPLMLDANQKQVTMAKIVPTQYELKFKLYLDSMYDVLKFSSAWIGVCENNGLSFTLTYYTFPLDILVVGVSDIPIVPKSVEVDEGIQAHEIEVTCTVDGYSIPQLNADAVFEVPMITQINHNWFMWDDLATTEIQGLPKPDPLFPEE